VRRTFYVTTPIYYVTAQPHIGTAYTTIAADVLARYRRQCGFDVHFLTGTDEHGLKVQRAAEEHGCTPRELADRVVAQYREAWDLLEISYDDFIRTTEPRHERTVQTVYQRLYDAGELYLADYEGWYCVSCESFLKESGDGAPKCPECGRLGERNAERSYFFRLGKYRDRLLAFYDGHPDFVQPQARMNEVRSRVEEGLRDLSVTRATLEWGVPMTFDPAHHAYVWIDALVNYISAIGYGSDPGRFSRLWPADVHIVGKDIIWFHAVIWPCLLMALGLEPPRMIFAHGWWTHNGEKMSKSKNNFVVPAEVVAEYGADAFRYFILRELPFGLDGDYRDSAMLQRYNSDLAGDLGNLVHRALAMIERYADGVLPQPAAEPRGPLAESLSGLAEDVERAMSGLQFSRALERIWEFVRRANQYVEERKPWELAKMRSDRPRLDATLYHLAESLRILSVLLAPTMPATAAAIAGRLGIEQERRPLPEALEWGGLRPGVHVRRGEPLFPRKE